MKTETNLPDTPGASALALATGSAPFFAYIERWERTGPDSWKDYRVHRIVWSVFDGWALTSLRGGGDLRVICANILIREPDPLPNKTSNDGA